MALGKKQSKDFIPFMKFDARDVSLSLITRVQDIAGEWETVVNKIAPEQFRAVAALDVLEVGWIAFATGVKPDTAMVAAGPDAAARWGDPPSDRHQLGIRLLWKMSPDLGGGIRELMGTSIGLWNGVDKLHDDYLSGAAGHPGELPIVGVAEIKEIKTRNGSTFEPIFKIVGWKERPNDLPNTSPTFSRVSKDTALAKPSASAKSPRADFDDQIPFFN
jgi:hypothetical protein